MILDEAVGPKSRVHGAFLSRLLFEWKARQEERLRVTAELQDARDSYHAIIGAYSVGSSVPIKNAPARFP